MRKRVSILLLSVFFVHSIGHFILMGGLITMWKQEVKNNYLSQKTDVELVKISKDGAYKIKDHGQEIEKNGERYDIVKETPEAFYCWHDAKETHLLKGLFQAIIEKDSKKSDHDFSILKDFFKLYFINITNTLGKKFFFVKHFFTPLLFNSFQLSTSFWQPPQC